MNYPSGKDRHDGQEKAPLLASGADEDYLPSDAEEYCGIFSGGSSPATSTHAEQEPSSPRVLNLEFGPLTPDPRLQTDIDLKILKAFEDLMNKREVLRGSKSMYDKVIDRINRLAHQYNAEQKKAPIYPPKGTWFHAERKLFPQKKAEHDEKLRSILRLRQAMIDDDEAKAGQHLEKARDAVNEAQTKLDTLRREKKMREA
jgi:hypothetical protein